MTNYEELDLSELIELLEQRGADVPKKGKRKLETYKKVLVEALGALKEEEKETKEVPPTEDSFSPNPKWEDPNQVPVGMGSYSTVPPKVEVARPASIEELAKKLECPGFRVVKCQPNGKSEIMLRALAAQGKSRFFIPREPREPKNAVRSITLNGLKLEVRKGTFVDLPLQVAEILSEGLNLEQSALDSERSLDNMDEKVRSHLGF